MTATIPPDQMSPLITKFAKTPTHDLTILDAPGHADFVPAMITGAASADVGLLVVAATPGEFEAGFEPSDSHHRGGQTREHIILSRGLGVSQLLVAVNKLDAADPSWSEGRFEEIKGRILPFLQTNGFKPHRVRFVPVSGLTGTNVKEAPGDDAGALKEWYKGPTLLDAIDGFFPANRNIDKPMRIIVSDLFTEGKGITAKGRCIQGICSVGDQVIVLPVNDVATVGRIEHADIFCAIHIQRVYRGHATRLRQKRSAQVIQRTWRSFYSNKWNQRLLSTTILLQSFVRRWQVAQKLQRKNASATLIQKIVRGHNVRTKREYYVTKKNAYDLKVKSATVIQTAWRSYDFSMNYLNVKLDIIIAQSVVRRWLVREDKKKSQECYVATKRLVRSYLIRSELKRILTLKLRKHAGRYLSSVRKDDLAVYESASLAVQTVWKRILCSIIAIQIRWKAYVGRSTFDMQRAAAVKVQRHYRSMHTKKVTGVTSIQALFRMVKCRQKYMLVTSAISIQAWWRKSCTTRDYQRTMEKIARIQSCVRRWIVEQDYHEKQLACLAIQGACRKKMQREDAKRIVALRKKKLVIKKRMAKQVEYREKMYASTAIQAKWRGYILRLRRKRDASATLLQSYARMLVAKKKLARVVLSVSIIQRSWRRYHAEMTFWELFVASSMIQAVWRGALTRIDFCRKVKAAVRIQACMRCHLEKVKYLELKHAATQIQAASRCQQKRQKYQRIINSIVTLQACVRRASTRAKYLASLRDIIKIQSAFRCYIISEDYLDTLADIITIQTYIRRFLANCRCQQMLKEKNSAIILQTSFRRYCAKKKYHETRSVATLLENCWRRHREEKRFKTIVVSTVKLQAQVRRYLAEESIFLWVEAAIILQGACRMYLQRCKHIGLRNSAIKVQSTARMAIARKQYHESRRVRAVCLVQAVARRFLAARRYHEIRASALVLEKNWRRYQAQKDRQRALSSAVKIQAQVRRYLMEECFLLVVEAAAIIQSVLRGYKEQRDYLALRRCTLRAQSCVRMVLSQSWYHSQRTAALCLQKHARRYAAQQAFNKTKSAVICIQRLARRNVEVIDTTLGGRAQGGPSLSFCNHVTGGSSARTISFPAPAAVVIQKNWRSYFAEMWYIDTILFTLSIQTAFRRHREEKKYRKVRNASLIVQRTVRMHLARRKFMIVANAVMLIQASWRKHDSCRKNKASVMIQAQWRARHHKYRFLVMCLNVLHLQATIRCFLTAAAYRRKLQRLHCTTEKCAALFFSEATFPGSRSCHSDSGSGPTVLCMYGLSDSGPTFYPTSDVV